MKSRNIFVATIFSLVLVALLLASFAVPAAASIPGPLAIPTPLSITSSSGQPQVSSFFVTKVITQDTTSTCVPIASHERMDLHHLVDQTIVAAAANTVTMKLQFSNFANGASAVDGATFLTSNAADATDMQQYALFGNCVKIFADVSNTNSVTITVVGVAK